MTLKVIYDIAANLSGLTSSVEKTAQMTESLDRRMGALQSTVRTVGQTIASAFSIAAVVGFVKAFLTAAAEYADALSNLQAKTDLSIGALQRLEDIGVTSGITVDQLADAVQNLQQRLGSGQAAEGLAQIGLKARELQALRPEDQFLTIAQRIGEIEDPVRRADVASAIFGRTWKSILPALRADVATASEGMIHLSDATAKRVDEATDHLEKFMLNVTRFRVLLLREMLRYFEVPPGHADAWERWFPDPAALAKKTAELRDALGSPWRGMNQPLPVFDYDQATVDRVLGTLDQQRERLEQTAAAAAKLAREMDRLGRNTDGTLKSVRVFGADTLSLTVKTPDLTDRLADLNGVIAELPPIADAVTGQFSHMITGGIAPLLDSMPELIVTTDTAGNKYLKLGEALDTVTKRMPVLTSIAQKLGPAIIGALQGGGDVLKTIGGVVGLDLGTRLSERFGEGIEKNVANFFGGGKFGKFLGETVSSAIPVIGSLLGPAIQGLGKLFGNLFGGEEKKINPIRQGFIDAAGGLDQLRESIVRATGSDALLRQLLNADKVREYEAAVTGVNGALERHQARLDQVRALIDGLAPAFNKFAAAGATSANSLRDMGTIALASIGAMIQAGHSAADALRAHHDGLSALRQSYKDLGLNVDNAALKVILMQDAILTKNPSLLEAIGGLSGMMKTLSELGLLNADTFDAMQRSGIALYTRLQGEVAALGGTTVDALAPMQDFLHAAETQAKALGLPLDTNLEILIAQSKELGIWQDVGKSATDRLVDGLNALIDRMDQFLNRLGAIPDSLPDPFRGWGAVEAPELLNVQPMQHGGRGDPRRPTLVQSNDGELANFEFAA